MQVKHPGEPIAREYSGKAATLVIISSPKMTPDERLDEWTAKGMFDRSRILERLELAAKNVLQPAQEKKPNGLHELD